MHPSVEDALNQLRTLWRLEQQAERARFTEQQKLLTLKSRVESGIALDSLSVVDMGAAPGDRLTLWLQSTKRTHDDGLQFRSGDPVILWFNAPDESSAVEAIVHRVTRDKVAVMIEGDLPQSLERDGFHMDQRAPEHTYKRGHGALTQALNAKQGSPLETLLHVCFLQEAPKQSTSTRQPVYIDLALNQTQKQAIEQALATDKVALIHGPPGTGKTRTLVELALQIRKNNDTILATAASNMAVDNLAGRLHDAGLNVVRLGHPTRVHKAAQMLSLDHHLEQLDLYQLAQDWINQARDLRGQLKSKRGRLSKHDQWQLRKEANALMREARTHIRKLQAGVLARADVICTTAAGAASSILKGKTFDWIIVDEATQVLDPILLIPAALGEHLVLAGDPRQLAPTVLASQPKTNGLDTTIFERLLQTFPQCSVMLNVQHRMHENIMHFPSISMYEGKLVAAHSVQGHLLEDLDARPDPLRPTPLVFLDCAGKGWEEFQDEDNPSLSNPEQAMRTALEVDRLLSRGLSLTEMAVITPYSAQAKLLRMHLAQWYKQGLEVSTIDSFQGREKEAIIVDLVRSNDRGELGFLKDTRRMNVALSRAKRFLMVIADSATLGDHPYYEQFLEVVQTHGTWVSAWADEGEPLEQEA